MNQFQSIIINIAIISLIILFIIIGVMLYYAKSKEIYPPVIADCPDYWLSQQHGKKELCYNTLNIMKETVMPPRNHKSWKAQPTVEYISSECYNNHAIFEQEQKQIFSKVWIPMCHTSEMYNMGDFRTTQIAGVNVIAYNTAISACEKARQ